MGVLRTTAEFWPREALQRGEQYVQKNARNP
jgi:hypothetical protein